MARGIFRQPPQPQQRRYTAKPNPPQPTDTYGQLILADGAIAYWRLGESGGITAVDVTGGHDGTYMGSPTLGASGIVGGGADTSVTLSGSNTQYVGTTWMTIPTPPISLECWVKFAGAPSDTSLGGWFSSAGVLACQLYLSGPTDNVRIGTEQGNANGAATGLLDGNWHHIVGTIDGTNGNARIYYDGALIGGPSAVTFNGGPSLNGLSIGTYPPSATSINATIDEWAVYPTALSAGTILAHYTAGATGASQTITLPLLDGAPALYAPSVGFTLTLGLLDSSSALYAPTLTPTNTLTLAVLDSVPALYAPSVGFTLTVPVLDAVNAVYSPTLTASATITLGLLDASSALYAPSVGFTITLGLLDSVPALYAPVAVVDQFVDLGLLDGAPALYAPAVGFTITLALLDSVSALYAPTLAPQPVTVTLGLLDGAPDIYAPTLAQAGGATQGITLALLDSGSAVYAPTITTTNAITLALLDSSPALYAPTVIADQFVTLGLLDGAGTLYAPAVNTGTQPITLGLLDALDDVPAGRPFAAPVTTATYTVPESIDRTGATDASAALQSWIDGTVPNGSVIDFASPEGIYRLDNGLLFSGRDNLVIRGHRHTTLNMVGADAEARSTFLLRGSSHIAVEDFTVHGAYSTFPTPAGGESHCLGLSGWYAGGPSSYVEMSGITGDHFYGDFVYLEGENVGAQAPSTNVWVHDNAFDYCGRNGVSFINCTDVMVEDNSFDHMAYHAVDFEANFDAEETRRIIVRNNEFGSYAHRSGLIGYFVADYSPEDPGVSDIVISGNTVAGIAANGYDATPRGLHTKFMGMSGNHRSNVVFVDNSTSQTVSGQVLYFQYVDGLVVGDNTQPMSSGTLLTLDTCTDVATHRGLYTPSVTTGPKTITVPLLDSGPALYAPTVIGDQFITLAVLDAANAVYAPVLAVGSVTITLGALDAVPAVYAPTVTPAAWTITLALLDAGPTVYAPTVVQDQFVTLGTIDGAPSVYAPSVEPKSTLTVPLLDAGSALYAPVVYPDLLVELALLDAVNAVYAPTIATGGTIALVTLDSEPTLYAPTVAPQAVGITVPQLDGVAALYAPSIRPTNTATLGLLDGLPALYAPTLTPKSTVTLALLESTPALYAPTLAVGAVGITVPYLDGVPVTYAPVLTAVGGGAQSLTLDLLDSGSALYAPTVTPAALTLTPPVLDAVPALYAPTVVNLAPYLVLPTLDAGAALYAPVVTPSWTLTVPFLDGVATVYAPELVKVNTIPLALIDASRALYPPMLTGGINLPAAIIEIVAVDAGLVGVGVGAGDGVVLSVASGAVAIVDIEG